LFELQQEAMTWYLNRFDIWFGMNSKILKPIFIASGLISGLIAVKSL
jgi:hypothetical protein